MRLNFLKSSFYYNSLNPTQFEEERLVMIAPKLNGQCNCFKWNEISFEFPLASKSENLLSHKDILSHTTAGHSKIKFIFNLNKILLKVYRS